MADFPALPLWTDAFLADTTHLDATETGVYMLLLMTAWRRPNNDLPNDDKDLRRYARVSAKQWRTIKPRVMKFWYLSPENTWRQKRLDKERDWRQTNTKKKQKAAAVRWSKPLENNKATDAPASPVHPTSISNPIHNHNNQGSFFETPSAPAGAVDAWPDDYRDVFWKLYPEKVGKKPALAKLDGCRKRGVVWAELIAGLNRYIRDKPADRSWMNPETFINQERWTDQRAQDGKIITTIASVTVGGSVLAAWDELITRTSEHDRDTGEDAIVILPPRPVPRS